MKKEVKEQIYSDLYRIVGNKKKTSLYKKMFSSEFRYMYLFRKYNDKIVNSSNKFVRKLYTAKLRKASRKYGYEIEPGCKIGEGFRLIHFGGVAINPNAVIGKNVTVFKGVTIGTQRRGKHKGAPVIADNVWIGSNSTVVGGINIGTDVMIAPNTYVNHDVPPHSICIGSPAKIIYRENATEGYIDNPLI